MEKVTLINQVSQNVFDLPKDKWEQIKSTEAGRDLAEFTGKKRKDEPAAISAVASPK